MRGETPPAPPLQVSRAQRDSAQAQQRDQQPSQHVSHARPRASLDSVIKFKRWKIELAPPSPKASKSRRSNSQVRFAACMLNSSLVVESPSRLP